MEEVRLFKFSRETCLILDVAGNTYIYLARLFFKAVEIKKRNFFFQLDDDHHAILTFLSATRQTPQLKRDVFIVVFPLMVPERFWATD